MHHPVVHLELEPGAGQQVEEGHGVEAAVARQQLRADDPAGWGRRAAGRASWRACQSGWLRPKGKPAAPVAGRAGSVNEPSAVRSRRAGGAVRRMGPRGASPPSGAPWPREVVRAQPGRMASRQTSPSRRGCSCHGRRRSRPSPTLAAPTGTSARGPLSRARAFGTISHRHSRGSSISRQERRDPVRLAHHHRHAPVHARNALLAACRGSTQTSSVGTAAPAPRQHGHDARHPAHPPPRGPQRGPEPTRPGSSPGTFSPRPSVNSSSMGGPRRGGPLRSHLIRPAPHAPVTGPSRSGDRAPSGRGESNPRLWLGRPLLYR